MSKLYRLEFSQRQQCFHFDNSGENINGWVVISNNCSDDEHIRFMDKIDSIRCKHLTIYDCFKYFNEIKEGNDVTEKIAKEKIYLN